MFLPEVYRRPKSELWTKNSGNRLLGLLSIKRQKFNYAANSFNEFIQLQF